MTAPRDTTEHTLTIEMGALAAVARCTCGEASPPFTMNTQVREWWRSHMGDAPFKDAVRAVVLR